MSGQKKPGRLTTQMKYHESDDTFTFTNHYADLRYEIGGCGGGGPGADRTSSASRAAAISASRPWMGS